MPSVIAWDIETVPDLRGFAAANGHDGRSDDEIRAALGDKFPKHIYHSIVCIGALVARRDNGHWAVDVLGAPSVETRSEKELIASFVGRIAGYENRRIGEYDYRFPRVEADVVYLWPVRETVDVVQYPAPWPWWGWW